MVAQNKNNSRGFALMAVTSILTGAEASHVFSAKLPSTMTIVSFVKSKEQSDAIIDGLVKANVGAAIIGGLITGASYVAKLKHWWLPGAATALVSGFMTWSYLDDLKKAPINNGGTAEMRRSEGCSLCGKRLAYNAAGAECRSCGAQYRWE